MISRPFIPIPLVLFSTFLHAQVILTEVMFDPAGSESTDEFVEIYNAGAVPVDLSGWRLGDGTSTDAILPADSADLTLLPGQFGIILDPNYFTVPSTTYDSLIPPEALLLTVESSTFGSGGLSNSTAEVVMLINAGGDTVQQYRYSLGNPSGFSDEKIHLTADNDSANWADSRRLYGTPGSLNSVTPRPIDGSIERLSILTATPIIGGTLEFEASVHNRGTETIAGFDWLTFYDHNRNGRPESGEVVENFPHPDPLSPGDSLILRGQFSDLPFGELHPGVALQIEGDGDTTNNVAVATVFVDNPAGVPVVINEIMFQPRTGYEEWVELYNRGEEPVNLRLLSFADSRDTISISREDRWLSPHEYAVLGGDSLLILQYALSPGQVIIRPDFPTLNNDFDDLRLLGPTGITYDRVPYTSEWYGRETDPGTSLEKIRPDLEGQLSTSWAASVAGSTPGRQNSVYVESLPAAGELHIAPNPFSPDGDGVEDFTVIRYQLPVETAAVNLRIFDIRGRKIRHLANGEPVAQSGQFVWDGKDDGGNIARIGAYICLFQALSPRREVLVELKKVIILIKR